jgi:clumping factor A
MRLRTALAAGVATAAITPALMFLGLVGTAAADPSTPDGHHLEPYCGDPDSAGFPIQPRIQRGPKAYPPGGDWKIWKLDLRNTTRTACRSIHPVIVFVDNDRKLAADRIGLEFQIPGEEQWRPVTFETTDRDEHIGVFQARGFKGFVVEPKKTVTLKVRMRFSSGMDEDGAKINVAAVQRRDDDGDWVGESNDYQFAIRDDDGDGDGSDEQREPGKEGKAEGYESREPLRRSDGSGLHEDQDRRPLPAAEAGELARTGKDGLTWLLGAAGLCVLGGVTLVILARRTR